MAASPGRPPSVPSKAAEEETKPLFGASVAESPGTLPLQSSHERPLTPWRLLRALCLLAALILTGFWAVATLVPVYVLVRLFWSVSAARSFAGFFFGGWLSTWVFVFEGVNETKFVFWGEKLPPGERTLLISNHTTEVDWMYMWCLGYRKQRLGSMKYTLKSSVRHAPLFGWAFHFLEFLLLDRNWEVDQQRIKKHLAGFQDRRDALWLVLFPEGTDFSEAKRQRGNKYARAHGLRELNHLLLPRTKGFEACIQPLRNSIDAVYDLTIAYVPRPPTFVENLLGTDPKEIHMHVRRVKVGEIPEDDEGCARWLFSTFEGKDELLASFHKSGQFPAPQIDESVSLAPAILAFCTFSALSVLVTWLAVLHPCIWGLVALSCVFSTTAVYLRWLPGSLLS